MAFKMRYKRGNFPFKHYPKGEGVHAHEGSDGKLNYHGKNRNTGRTSTYDTTTNEDGETVLTRNPSSNWRANKFDE